MRRLALDDNDAKARDWFVQETKKLGCTKHVVDEVGQGSIHSRELVLSPFSLFECSWAISLLYDQESERDLPPPWVAI
jgi:hypothetical protein